MLNDSTFEQCLLRVASWASAALLAVLSLLPADAQIRTGAPGTGEHVVAYFAAAALFAAAYQGSRRVQIVLWLAAYAGILELAQALVPGRSATLWDFAASTIGVMFGAIVGYVLVSRLTRLRTTRPRIDPK